MIPDQDYVAVCLERRGPLTWWVHVPAAGQGSVAFTRAGALRRASRIVRRYRAQQASKQTVMM